MSIIDRALEANRNYAKSYNPTLGKRPAPKIAVVTCMDPRLSDLPGILGLPQADIDVIRTGGPAVTEDVLGSLLFPTVYSEPQRYCCSTTPAAGSRHSQMTK
jgi:carbonic anhydrase